MRQWWLEQSDLREYLTCMGVGLSAYLTFVLAAIQWFAP